MHNIQNQRTQDQQGFVSLVIALTLVIILALLTVGFTQLSRHEQQRALDKQLSVQATYAAETGINDAIKAVNNGFTPPAGPDQCTTLPAPYTQTINGSVNVSYKCLLIDKTPKSLVFNRVAANSARTITFSTSGPLTDLIVSWGSDPPGMIGFPGSLKFLPKAAWTAANTPAVLQFSVTPYSSVTFDRASLIRNNFTSYLYPSTLAIGPGNVYADGIGNNPSNGPVLSGHCPTAVPDYPCSVDIKGLNTALLGAGGSGPFMVHFLNYYSASRIEITAKNGASNLNFINGQAIIDSTGVAQDVSKRLQVHVTIGGNVGGISGSGLSNLPTYSLEAQNICKRVATEPVVAGTKFIGTNNAAATALNNPSCILSP